MIILILGMVLARMIWIQLRFFPVNVDYRSLVTFGALMDPEQPSTCFEQYASKDQLWALLTDNELVSDKRYRWFRVPGLELLSRAACGYGAFTPQTMQWFNYLFFGGTVFLAMLMVRMLSGSWFIGLVAAAMLLSRGQLVAKIGELTSVNSSMFLCTLMMTCFVHYLRTASWITFTCTLATLFLLTSFDIPWIVSLLTFPTVLLSWWMLRRLLSLPTLKLLRSEPRQKAPEKWPRSDGKPADAILAKNSQLRKFLRKLRAVFGFESSGGGVPLYLAHAYERGGLLRPLVVPYSFWVLHRRRWLKLMLYGYTLGLLTISLAVLAWLRAMPRIIPLSSTALLEVAQQISASVHWPWVSNWLEALRAPIDLHFAASLVVVFLALFQSPSRGLHGFFETSWVLVTGLSFLVVATFIVDVVDARVLIEIEGEARGWSIYGWSRAPHVFTWIEPTVLSLGLVGVYNLLKIADSRFVQSAPQR